MANFIQMKIIFKFPKDFLMKYGKKLCFLEIVKYSIKNFEQKFRLQHHTFWLRLDFYSLGFWEWVTGGGPALTLTQVPDSLVLKCRVAAY